jgi:hypothetical protein
VRKGSGWINLAADLARDLRLVCPPNQLHFRSAKPAVKTALFGLQIAKICIKTGSHPTSATIKNVLHLGQILDAGPFGLLLLKKIE